MQYPALDVSGVEAALALAVADDFSPSAAEEHADRITVFFATAADRDGAREAIGRELPVALVVAREVDDEDWARRSQENLEPITVGRIVVVPARTAPGDWLDHLVRLAEERSHDRRERRSERRSARGYPERERASDASGGGAPRALEEVVGVGPHDNVKMVVIQPSMGFGTGHHATTRLCLAGLQRLDLADKTVLDVGTGSGVLAIAARCLGARNALGIDNDPDAIRSAIDNLSLNPDVTDVRFEAADLRFQPRLPRADVVTANLTGGLLLRTARTLTSAVLPGGALIVGGLLGSERDEVVASFDAASLVSESREEEWTCLVFRRAF